MAAYVYCKKCDLESYRGTPLCLDCETRESIKTLLIDFMDVAETPMTSDQLVYVLQSHGYPGHETRPALIEMVIEDKTAICNPMGEVPIDEACSLEARVHYWVIQNFR